MPKSRWWITTVLLLTAVAAAGAQEGAEAPKRVELPHAGVSLAVPADYELQPPSREFEVLAAVLGSDEGVLKLVRLEVGMVDVDEEPAGLLEEQYIDMRKSGMWSGLKQVSSADVRVAGRGGAARVLRYDRPDGKRYLAQVTVVRPLAGKDWSLAYTLSAEARQTQRSGLIDVLQRVSRSMEFMEVRPVREVKLELLASPVVGQNIAASMPVPVGWYGGPGPYGMTAGVADYSLGLRNVMLVQLGLRPEQGQRSAAEAVEQLKTRLEETREAVAEQQGQEAAGNVPEISAEADGKLGSLEAKHLVLQSPNSLTVRRIAARAHEGNTLTYLLDIQAPDGEYKDKASELMEMLAPRVKMLEIPKPEGAADAPAAPQQ
jgi:hypothetical protein